MTSDNAQNRPPGKDKVIANTGWGIKPDDQPANSREAQSAPGAYQYDPATPDVVRTILRLQRRGFNTANRIRVEPGRTTIFDINKDPFVVQGLTFGNPHLSTLLKALGASFNPSEFKQLKADFDGTREFSLSRAWAWGAERTG